MYPWVRYVISRKKGEEYLCVTMQDQDLQVLEMELHTRLQLGRDMGLSCLGKDLETLQLPGSST